MRCGKCAADFPREDFRVTRPGFALFDANGRRVMYATHKRCRAATVVSDRILRVDDRGSMGEMKRAS